MGTTAAQKKLFFNLRRLKGQMQAIEEGDLKPDHVKAIATKLDVSEDDVVSMNRRMSGGDSSLNAPMRSDGEAEWQDWLLDDAETQEETLVQDDEHEVRMGLLRDAMGALNEREQHILTERRLAEEPKTLEELSVVYKVSRERVRQIEVRAFEKLQAAMHAAAQDRGLTESAGHQI